MKFGRYLTFLTLLISCGVAAGETSAPEASETFGVHADIANVVVHSPKKNISYKSHSKKSAPFQPVIKPYIPVAGNHAKSARKILVAHVTQHEDFHPQFKPFFPAEKKHSGKMQLTSQSKSGFHPKIKLFVPAQHQYAMKVRTVKKHKQAAYHVAAKSTTAHGKKLAKQTVKSQVANNENQEIKQDIRVADDLQPMPMKYAEVIIKANKLQVALKNMDMPKAAAVSTVEAEKKSEAVTPERKVDPILGKKIMADANLGGRMVGIKIPAAKPALKIITSAAVGVNPSAIKADTAVHAMFVSQTKKTSAKTVGMPIPENLLKQTVQRTAQTAAAVPVKQKEKYFSSDKIDTQPPVKFVAGDLSKDEFYILGENDPVPEKLATNPETEIAILGGDENEAAKKIMEFKLAAIQAAKERAQKELAAREISTKVLEDLDFEEREAKANLAAAQKAMDDVKKLKKWHQETDTPIGEIVDNVGPAYKDSIVNSVVPDKIKPKEQIVAEKKGIIPIDQITISDEMVMPDGEIEVAANQPPQQDVNIQKQQPVKIQDKPLLHQNRTVAHRGKKAKPGDLKELAAEQINTAVLGIKSGYEKKKSRGQKTLVEKNALANDADKVKAQEAGQHVIDYEADSAERFTITESQEVIVTHAQAAPKAIAQTVEKNKNAKPVAVNLAKPAIAAAVAENTVKANIAKADVPRLDRGIQSNKTRKNVAEKAVKPSASKPAAKEIAKAKAVKLNPAKPAIVDAEKPEAAKPVAVNAIKPEAAKPAAANAIKLEAAKPAAVNPVKLEADKPAAVNAIKLEAAKPAAVPEITPDVAKPVNVSAAKPKIEKMKPVKKVEIITYSEHDMSKVMNDLEKVVWQQKKLKMKAAKENKAKKTVTAEKSSPDDLDELSSSEEM